MNVVCVTCIVNHLNLIYLVKRDNILTELARSCSALSRRPMMACLAAFCLASFMFLPLPRG